MDKKCLKVKIFLNFFGTYKEVSQVSNGNKEFNKKCPRFHMTIKDLTKSVLDFTFVINFKKSQGKDFFNFFKPNKNVFLIVSRQFYWNNIVA